MHSGSTKMTIERIFFDVGNVIFNDDAQAFHAYRWFFGEIQKVHPDYTFDQMLAEREDLASRGESWNLHAIASRYLSPEQVEQVHHQSRQWLIQHYDTNHLLNPGVVEVIEKLSDEFRLGIIANQPPECRESLRRRQLLDFFDVVAISEELDLHKPHPQLYLWALERVEQEPACCVMVGDRLDNDVKPARLVGMRTIWIRWPKASVKPWAPDDPLARAFVASCDRVPLFNPPQESDNVPDYTIHAINELPDAIRAL